MNQELPLFQTPVLKCQFNESIRSILCTDTFAYFVLENGIIFRTLNANLRLPIDISNMENAQPWGNSNIKKVMSYYWTSTPRKFYLLCLVDSNLYSISEEEFPPKQRPKPIAFTGVTSIEDFSISSNNDRICLVSRKTIASYSLRGVPLYSPISSIPVETSDSSIVASNDHILLYGKSVSITAFGQAEKVEIPNISNPRFAGISIGYETSEIERMSEGNTKHQFFVVSKSNVQKNHEVIYLNNGPYSSFRWIIPDTIADFMIVYPYAFSTHGSFFHVKSVITSVDQNFNVNSQFSNRTLCALSNNAIVFGSNKDLYYVQMIRAADQINNLIKKINNGENALLPNAIRMCLAFPEYEPEILPAQNKLFHKYGERLLEMGDPQKAFYYFSRDNHSPIEVLSHFGCLIPYDYYKDASRLNENQKGSHQRRLVADYSLLKNKSDKLEKYDKVALKEVLTYIRQVINTSKPDIQIRKALNTTMMFCIAVVEPENLDNFLKSETNLYFTESTNFFIINDMVSSYSKFCQIHKQHDHAIKFFHDKRKMSDLIEYIQSSTEFFDLARREFSYLIKEKADVAYKLFCSPHIKDDHPMSILSFIEDLDVSKELKCVSEINFLVFFLFTMQKKKDILKKKLIELYIQILSETAKTRTNLNDYIPIQSEMEPVKTYRQGLILVLDEFDGLDIMPEIDPCFIEEKLVALMLHNDFSQCFTYLTHPSLDFSIAIDFCNKVVKKGGPHSQTIFTELFMKLTQVNTETSRTNIIKLINSKADLIDISVVMQKIPVDIKLKDIRPFLTSVTVDRVNKTRLLSLENALMESTLGKKQRQLSYLLGGYVEMKHTTCCAVCGNQFIDQPFIIQPDNTIIHLFCKEKDEQQNK